VTQQRVEHVEVLCGVCQLPIFSLESSSSFIPQKKKYRQLLRSGRKKKNLKKLENYNGH
jgi:hypothetical protein